MSFRNWLSPPLNSIHIPKTKLKPISKTKIISKNVSSVQVTFPSSWAIRFFIATNSILTEVSPTINPSTNKRKKKTRWSFPPTEHIPIFILPHPFRCIGLSIPIQMKTIECSLIWVIVIPSAISMAMTCNHTHTHTRTQCCYKYSFTQKRNL